MATIWFWLVALMLTVYVVLDGFDLGVGALHFIVGRSRPERNTLLRTIGPVWDGNEVWLIAAGGTLYFAFPLLYAAAFSGFYLPLMIVLWLLILRGIGIELREHFESDLWQDFFDGLFFIGSGLLAFFLGVALANVIRGVPIGPDLSFFLPLWTNFRTGAHPGILDWYTVLGGLLALVALAEHGALYLLMKTDGLLRQRVRRVAQRLSGPLAGLTAASLLATIWIRPESVANYLRHPIGFVFPAGVTAALILMRLFMRRGNDAMIFAASTAYLAAMLLGAAFGLDPVLMPSTLNAAQDITIANAQAAPYGLTVGLVWWGFGIAMAVAYFLFVYRMFRGRVQASPSH